MVDAFAERRQVTGLQHDNLCLLGGNNGPRGEINRFHNDGCPVPPPPVGIAGGGVVAQLHSGGRVMESDANNVPCARRGTTAVANTVAFFGWMDAFVPW